jgi:hypothetical protein
LEDPGAKWYDYIEINPMPAKDAFKIMEEFVKTVDNHELSEKLLGALDNKQPFKNFKWLRLSLNIRLK